MSLLAYPLFGFLVSLLLSWLAIHLGRRLKLLDLPTGIKVHALPIPYTGGAAMTMAVVIAAITFELPLTIVLGGVGMWLVGFLDDRRNMRPRAKLLSELVPLVIGASGLGLDPLTFFGAIVVGAFLVNCFNVIDGLDGLAAGVALMSLIAMVSFSGGAVSIFAGILAGVLVGFLVFNLHPARLFMGDQGSLMIGYFLWVLPLANFSQHRELRELVAGVLLWAFPLTNAAFVIGKRLLEGRPLLVGDRGHLYDVLHVRFGLRATLVASWAVAACSGIAAGIAGS